MHRFIRIIILVALTMLSAVTGAARDFVVVIDAGHGGHDYGAIGTRTNEKTINLGVALKLGALIKKNMEDVKVVYTRDGDYFKQLQERAEIANRAHGDLFISIHTNSVDKKNRNRRTINGAATYTLGLHKSAENLAVAKRENSVMMLEDDFSTTYCGFDPNSTESYIIFELSQNRHMEQSIDFASRVQSEMVSTAGRKDNGVRQAGFWVLAKTGMPAVLIELEFICNPASEEFLRSDKGQTKFAKAIYNAFKSYRASYDPRSADEKKADKERDGLDAGPWESSEPSERAPEVTEDNPEPELRYKVQFLTMPRKLRKGASELKGVKNFDWYRDGGMYKYTVGDYRTLDEAQKELRKMRKKFSDAFVITTRDGERIK